MIFFLWNGLYCKMVLIKISCRYLDMFFNYSVCNTLGFASLKGDCSSIICFCNSLVSGMVLWICAMCCTHSITLNVCVIYPLTCYLKEVGESKLNSLKQMYSTHRFIHCTYHCISEGNILFTFLNLFYSLVHKILQRKCEYFYYYYDFIEVNVWMVCIY